MERLTEEQRKLLNDPIPPDAVTQRRQSGQTLDYVEGWWVIAQLNEILGPDGWSFEVLREAWPMPLGERTNSAGEPRLTACFQVTGRLTFADGSTREDIGIGSGVSKSDPVSVIEGATKEAVTDCIKRCARQLGHRTGGALYDKTRQHVKPEPLEPTRIHYGQSRGKRIQDAPTDWLTNYLGKLPKDCPKEHRSAVEAEISKRINKEAEAAE